MAVAETLMQPAIATAMEILEEGLGILWFPFRTNAVHFLCKAGASVR
jgi:hypothetical protein